MEDDNLTSFNPFSEEDQCESSSYTLVTSLFSRVKKSFTTPVTSSRPQTQNNSNTIGSPTAARTWNKSAAQHIDTAVKRINHYKLRPYNGLSSPSSTLAPPLVSVVPVVSETPTFNLGYEIVPTRSSLTYSSGADSQDGGLLSSIPGFPIPDDTKSIHTTITTFKRSGSVSRIIRRIRGEGVCVDKKVASYLLNFYEVYLANIGWMTRTVRSVMIVKVFLPLGEESTIVVYVV